MKTSSSTAPLVAIYVRDGNGPLIPHSSIINQMYVHGVIDILGFGAPLCYLQIYGRWMEGQDPGGALVSLQFAGKRFKSHCGEVRVSSIWPVQTDPLGKYTSAYIHKCAHTHRNIFVIVHA